MVLKASRAKTDYATVFKTPQPSFTTSKYLLNDLGRTALFFVYKIQWRIQAKGPLLFLDQTEAQRAEKFFWRPPPALSKGLDDRVHPYLKVWIPHVYNLLQ